MEENEELRDCVFIGPLAGREVTYGECLFILNVPTVEKDSLIEYKTTMTPEESKVIRSVLVRAMQNTREIPYPSGIIK